MSAIADRMIDIQEQASRCEEELRKLIPLMPPEYAGHGKLMDAYDIVSDITSFADEYE